MKKPTPLKLAIVASGRRAKTVARLARVNVTLLSHWCNGRRAPKPEEAERLAGVLDTPVDALFPPKVEAVEVAQ